MSEDPLFDKWWEDHGQYVRAGGGQYEILFAFSAWQAARAMPADLMQRFDHIDTQGYVHWKKSDDKTGPESVSDAAGRDRGLSGTGTRDDSKVSQSGMPVGQLPEKPTADTPYVEVDGVTYLARWHENKSSYVVDTARSTPSEPDGDARNRVIEECARIAEDHADGTGYASDCTAAIRALAHRMEGAM